MAKVFISEKEITKRPATPVKVYKPINGFEIGLRDAMITTAVVAVAAYLLAKEMDLI